MPSWIDSHSHFYLTPLNVIESLKAQGLVGVVEASWIPVRPSAPETLRDLFRWVVQAEQERLSKIGVLHIPAAGIHPRCIPEDLDGALSILEDFLGQAKALGEVGLETASEDERRAFTLQLRLAKKYDLPAIVHTPRLNKALVASKEIEVVDEVGFPRELTVIDHMVPQAFSSLKERLGEFNVGISLQPGKASVDEAIQMLSYLSPERVLVNSDTSTEPSEPERVRTFLERLESASMKEVSRMIAIDNPRRLFKV